MISRLSILLLSAALFSQTCYSQISSDDDRLRDIIKRYGQAEVIVVFTGSGIPENLSRNVSINSVSEKVTEIVLSPLTVEWFIRQKFSYSIKEKPELKGIITAASMSKAFGWDSYPTYTQYDSIMQSFVSDYPLLCRLDTIGTSINGKLVLALKISDNPAEDETEPEVFYSSTLHGDETGGYILMLRLADYLLKNYNSDLRVKELADNLEIWINPLANPDGTYNNGNVIATPTRFNSNGIDLNRNFPDPLAPGIVSEKETLDMISFMRSHRFVISANFHAGAELVNYPWDRWLSIYHADNDWFNDISRAYADTAHVYSEPGYMSDMDDGVTRGSVWYVVYGGRQDFVTQELHGREVTIELDYTHITPASQLPILWENNWRSLLGYLENALYGIYGTILDSQSYAPVGAKVFIQGHDKDSSQVYSDPLTGSFVRMLSSGTWPITFSARGYRDTTVSVLVYPGQKTEITLYMKRGTTPPDTTMNEQPSLYPNPASSVINAVLPEAVLGNVNVVIFSNTGALMAAYDTEVFTGVPLIINLERFPPGTYQAAFTNNKNKTSARGRFVVIK
jgi:hypothetical protein